MLKYCTKRELLRLTVVTSRGCTRCADARTHRDDKKSSSRIARANGRPFAVDMSRNEPSGIRAVFEMGNLMLEENI